MRCAMRPTRFQALTKGEGSEGIIGGVSRAAAGPASGGFMADWRPDSCGHLRGLRLMRWQWVQPNASWDHDHCAVCWSKFADWDGPDVQREGFTTCDDYKHGANYE